MSPTSVAARKHQNRKQNVLPKTSTLGISGGAGSSRRVSSHHRSASPNWRSSKLIRRHLLPLIFLLVALAAIMPLPLANGFNFFERSRGWGGKKAALPPPPPPPSPPPPLPPPPPTMSAVNSSGNGTGNGTLWSKEGSLADMVDQMLDKEFADQETQEGGDNAKGSNFNTSVADQQAVLETVARVTHDRPRKKNDTSNETSSKEDDGSGAQDAPTLIDSKDNVFVMMNPREGNMVLQQDLRFISDLIVVIVAAAVGGIVFASIGQPVITGYLLAGSLIGPGCLNLVSELVQVETMAQFGVLFLLFALGMEFSVSKLRAVRAVALGGGIIQIGLFLCLCGLSARLCGGRASEGVFVGALLSMSSTAVVLKCLAERNSAQLIHGQITIATLIVQDCAVGLLFALLPVLGGSTSILHGVISMLRVVVLLLVVGALAVFVGSWATPRLLKLLVRLSVQTSELYQLATIAFALAIAWTTDRLGLSAELGAFLAGVLVSTSDLCEHTLQQVEPVRNLFGALFLASIGMIMNPGFLWRHMDILAASLVLVVLAKTILITVVVRCFGHSLRTALTVGISLAQIGEFAFVLLSRASKLHLVQKKLYLLLLGTTALSLVSTPLLFNLIPHMIRLGQLLRWIRPDSELPSTDLQNGAKEQSGRKAAVSLQAPWPLTLAMSAASKKYSIRGMISDSAVRLWTFFVGGREEASRQVHDARDEQ